MSRLAALALAVAAASCLTTIDLNDFTFSCNSDSDCTSSQECIMQVCTNATGGGAGGGAGGGTGGGGGGGSVPFVAGPAFHVGACDDAGTCWVNPFPAGHFTALALVDDSWGYVVAANQLFIFSDGGLDLLEFAGPVQQLGVAQGAVFGDGAGIRELWPALSTVAAPDGTLAVTDDGGVWVLDPLGGNPLQFDGAAWVEFPVDACDGGLPLDAPIGQMLVRWCPGAVNGELVEYSGTRRVIDPDAGPFLSLVARSAESLLATVPDSGVVLIDEQTGATASLSQYPCDDDVLIQADDGLICADPAPVGVGTPQSGFETFNSGFTPTAASAFGQTALITDGPRLIQYDLQRATSGPALSSTLDSAQSATILSSGPEVLLACGSGATAFGAIAPIGTATALARGSDGGLLIAAGYSLVTGEGVVVPSPSGGPFRWVAVAPLGDGAFLAVANATAGAAFILQGGAFTLLSAIGAQSPVFVGAGGYLDGGALIAATDDLYRLDAMGRLLENPAYPLPAGTTAIVGLCLLNDQPVIQTQVGIAQWQPNQTWTTPQAVGTLTCLSDGRIAAISGADVSILTDGGWVDHVAPFTVESAAASPDGGLLVGGAECQLVAIP